MKQKSGYQKFEELTTRLIRVPHSEIRAKLDEEKKAKDAKKKAKAQK